MTNVDEQPVLSGDSAVSYAENGAAAVASYTAADPENATITWTLSGDDSDDFSISAAGALSFNSSPDFETPADADTDNIYQVTVEASDGTTDKVTLAVTVTVTNVDEVGAVALSPAQPVVGTALTATLTDPDGSITGTTWVWASSTDGSTGWTDISSATAASYTPVDADVGNYLRATATYTDGHASGKSAQGVSANQVLLTTLELDKATLLAAKPILEGTGTALNWATDVDIANWDGINLYDDTGVKIIDLNDHGLTGSIAPQLGDLAYLETLKLWSSSANNPANQFSGGIPAELAKLSNLTRLELNNAGLDGAIPAALGNLSSLQTLNLDSNNLTGPIPRQLANLSNLTNLQLKDNRLSGTIPLQLGELSNLDLLHLQDNQLSGAIPPGLSNLASLTIINLSGNQLSGSIPAALANLTNLQYLSLENNNLGGGIPAVLGSLANLTTLILTGNQLNRRSTNRIGKPYQTCDPASAFQPTFGSHSCRTGKPNRSHSAAPGRQ